MTHLEHLEGHRSRKRGGVWSFTGHPWQLSNSASCSCGDSKRLSRKTPRSSTTMTSRSLKDFARWNKQICYVKIQGTPIDCKWLMMTGSVSNSEIPSSNSNWSVPCLDSCITKGCVATSARPPSAHPQLQPIESLVPLINSPQPIHTYLMLHPSYPNPAPPKQRRVQCHHHHHRFPVST